MKVTYLGTAAAERVPAIFCNCRICRHAMEKKGREIRTQTQALLDDGKLLIDFPGDSYLHRLSGRVDYNRVEALLLTHWHSDHFYGEDLAYRMSGYANGITTQLAVYGNAYVKGFYDRAFQLEGRYDEQRLTYHLLEAYQKTWINGYEVYSLPAQHGHFAEDCFIYVIKDPTGKTLLYGHDTGYLTEEMFAFLEANKFIFDCVSMDCTGQTNADQMANHMNWSQNIQMKQELMDRKLATEKTIFVANHFSHNGGKTYQEMADLSASEMIITAYDGLEIHL
ncbi:MBL fold metallo-hydrolase [Enterococcus gallinarum]|uniref:MBL fold metallo-hydrolase n=1 Tax=Enterococcus TaxID=1350 RepID=UPI003F75CDB5